MKSITGILPQLPQYMLARKLNRPGPLPVNITVTPSPRCNSRCKTCNIWMEKTDELTLTEWEAIFRSLGEAPYWITISGGEPFLYPDLVPLCRLIARHCRPGIVNIPHNSLIADVEDKVEQIAAIFPDASLIINLSLDGLGVNHDQIRGIRGNFARFERTLSRLLALRQRAPNLSVGIHSVVSTFNIDQIEALADYAAGSGADHYITEMAEQRVELGTMGLPISPDPHAYQEILDMLSAHLESASARRVSRLTRAFRLEYYQLVKRILNEKTQVIPCYAGWASAHIYADGNVWGCCIRAETMGNLRDVDYDFRRVWTSQAAHELRRSISAHECHCPLANASYTNLLLDPASLARVSGRVIKGAIAGSASPPDARAAEQT
jgi:MoaA/NifB/PqqE/SkfB family radical SAM enzyme